MTQYSQQSFLLHPVLGENVLEEAIEKLEPIFQRRIHALEVCYTKFSTKRSTDVI